MPYWYKGSLHEGGVALPAGSPSFRHGAGFCGTVFWNGNEAWLLDRHVVRLESSLARFGFSSEPCNYHAVIRELVAASGMQKTPARVDISMPMEDGEATCSPLITASPWQVPAPDAARTLRLASSPVQTPLGAHNTMSGFSEWLERRNARRDGYDDAILAMPSGTVLGTTTAALVFGDGNNFCTPNGPGRLRSTVLERAREILPIHSCTIRIAEMYAFKRAYVISALAGMLPVRGIDAHTFEVDVSTCNRLRPALLGLPEM